MSTDVQKEQTDPELDQAVVTLLHTSGWAQVYAFVDARAKTVRCPGCAVGNEYEMVTNINGESHVATFKGSCTFCEGGLLKPGRLTLLVDGEVFGRIDLKLAKWAPTSITIDVDPKTLKP